MVICNNADEYERELNKLQASFLYGIKPQKQVITEIDVFIKNQLENPIYIFKANRRYYKLKINWITGEYRKSKKPIPPARLLLLRRQKPDWIIEYKFPNSNFDFVICPNCKREFTRYYPNEKYCFRCQRSPRSKKPLTIQDNIRYCQNCEKPIPAGKNKRTKYCCGACRTAACMKRKSIISLTVLF